MSVCVSVCPPVRLSFCHPLPEVGCPIFLEIWNPWGKVMEKNGLRWEHFCSEVVLNCQTKKNSLIWLILPYKTRWKPRFPFLSFAFWMIFSVFQTIQVFGYSWSTRKPRFPMDWRPLVEGLIANFGLFLDILLSFSVFDDFFSFSINSGFWLSWSTLLWYRC